MSARVEMRTDEPVALPGRPVVAAAREIRAVLVGMAGPAPLATRPGLLGPAIVAALVATYALGLIVLGESATVFVRLPLFAAAVLLDAPLAMIVGGASLFADVLLVPPGGRVGPATIDALDAVAIVLSAGLIRAIVVAAMTSRRTRAHVEDLLDARAAQLAVLQAASARLSRASGVEAIGRAIVEETRGIIDYHNARVYLLEPGGDVVPIAFEGVVGEYEKVDFDLLRCRLGQGFTGWVALHGTPLLVDDANLDPRGASIPGTDDVDESMLVVPMIYDGAVTGVITLSKLGLRQFDEADQRLLLILADLAATAIESARLLARSDSLATELRRLLDMGSQLSGSLDPRQVANLIARHLALAMGFDECAISYWDKHKRHVVSLGYYPEAGEGELEPYFDVAGFPQTLRVLEEQATVVIDAEDPDADAAEVALLAPTGNRMLLMLPLVAKGESVGLVELLTRHAIAPDEERIELARTMANEAAMALENARLYEEARSLADRDPLTSFYNHRYLHERFGEEILRAQRSGRPLSVLMLDLDDFKLVNDTFGHLFGDQVLAWTAEVIRATLRASDVPARYGGDEFAILLPDTSAEAAGRAAARIHEAFAGSGFDAGTGRTVGVGVAIGAATFPDDGRTARELIATADAGLYREKRSGTRVPATGPEAARNGRATKARPAGRRRRQGGEPPALTA
jgi:diguanylate cyclase (GGDEF)-like protein